MCNTCIMPSVPHAAVQFVDDSMMYCCYSLSFVDWNKHTCNYCLYSLWWGLSRWPALPIGNVLVVSAAPCGSVLFTTGMGFVAARWLDTSVSLSVLICGRTCLRLSLCRSHIVCMPCSFTTAAPPTRVTTTATSSHLAERGIAWTTRR